jgi:predicted phosphoribosyltransferase
MFTRTRFADRRQAGRQLAAALKELDLHDPVIYALPRGGVPVGFEVAAALKAPLDLLLVRKIGAPYQPELAVGAIVDGAEPEVVLNDDIVAATGADAAYLARERTRALHEIERRRAVYGRAEKAVDPTGHDAVIVDDGLATGATALVAVHALKRRGARRVLVATPVAPPDTVERLQRDADEVICLAQPEAFGGVSAFYDDFHQLDDDEVVALLAAATR